MKIRLTRTPASAMRTIGSEYELSGRTRPAFSSSAQPSAIARLASGPAAATQAMCCFGFLSAE